MTITPANVPLNFEIENAATAKGTAAPMRDTVHAQITDKGDGFFVEGPVGDTGSMIPLGITPDLSKKVGTYFYAVGLTRTAAPSTASARLCCRSKNRKHGHGRDDDDHDRDGKRDDVDDDDDDDGNKDVSDNDDDDDCVNDPEDWDDDNDGIDDKDDRKDRRQTRDTREEESVSGAAVGELPDGPRHRQPAARRHRDGRRPERVAEPGNPTIPLACWSPVRFRLRGSQSRPCRPRTAGSYTVRIKNLGLTPTAIATGIVDGDQLARLKYRCRSQSI